MPSTRTIDRHDRRASHSGEPEGGVDSSIVAPSYGRGDLIASRVVERDERDTARLQVADHRPSIARAQVRRQVVDLRQAARRSRHQRTGHSLSPTTAAVGIPYARSSVGMTKMPPK